MSPITLSLAAFATIFGASVLGTLLPGNRFPEGLKDVIRLGAGLIGTIAGLVLGLLISSANGTFDNQATKVRQIAADIILIDGFLDQYGPESRKAREFLRAAVHPMVEQIWRADHSGSTNAGSFKATAASMTAYLAVQTLSPKNDVQQSLKAQALSIYTDLAQTRLALFVAADSKMPMPFVLVLIIWLAIIFASFGLFADRHHTVLLALFVFALAASTGLFMILELSQPFSGLMQISSERIVKALAPLD